MTVEPWHGIAAAPEVNSRLIRCDTLAEVQKILAGLIATAEDSYAANKDTPAGLIAFGQRLSLRAMSERLHWMAAQ